MCHHLISTPYLGGAEFRSQSIDSHPDQDVSGVFELFQEIFGMIRQIKLCPFPIT